MKDAIEYKEVGECKIIHSLATKRWNLLCRVIKHRDTYKLVEYTLKGKQKMSVAISEEDAKWLINTFSLKYIKSEVFNDSGAYLTV